MEDEVNSVDEFDSSYIETPNNKFKISDEKFLTSNNSNNENNDSDNQQEYNKLNPSIKKATF